MEISRFTRIAAVKGVTYSILTILCLFTHSTLLAQEGPQGFLNIANLVPSESKVKINIAGKELVPGGLTSIESTGWFIVPAGQHNMSLQCEGYKPGSGSITVEEGVSTLYIIYLQQLGSKTDKDGKPNPPSLRVKRSAPFQGKNAHNLQIMSVCPTDEPITVGPHKFTLEPFKSQEISGWRGGTFTVKRINQDIGSCSGSQEKGSYLLLIGSDHVGKYASLLVRNEQQELPPWMKKNSKPDNKKQP